MPEIAASFTARALSISRCELTPIIFKNSRMLMFSTSAQGRSGQTLVDLGCGDMPYRMLYQPLVDRYIGVDLSSNARADMHFDGAGKVPLPDGSADVVLSTQVLEHVSSPQQYLAEARRLLRPGGVLFLSTHGYWMFHPDPTDYWRWTGEGLKTEIAKAGFRVERCRGVMNLASAGVQLFQDGLTPRVPSFLRSAFFWTMNRLMALVDRKGEGNASRDIDASVFIVTARKDGMP